MKKVLLNNLGIKILSVICAIILWLVVMNVSDSRVTKRVDDIPVNIINEDALYQRDKLYDIQKGDTVSIVVKGKRSVVEKLTAEDFIAEADLSQVSITNAVQIMVKPVKDVDENDYSITVVDNTMVITLDDKVKKSFPIKINTAGTVEEGYAISELSCTPNIITVEGPESSVEKIEEVAVTLDVDTAKDDRISNCEIVAYDAYGDVVMNDRIKFSQNVVETTAKINPKKHVNVDVSVVGKPADGYEVAEIIYEPKQVSVVGSLVSLRKLNSIKINDISVEGLSETYETTININEYLPNGTSLAQDDENIVLTIKIEKVVEEKLNFTETNIKLKNNDSKLDYKIKLSSDFDVTALGLEDKINGITVANITPTIDCSKLTLGDNYNVELILDKKDGITYKIVGTVSVNVSKK